MSQPVTEKSSRTDYVEVKIGRLPKSNRLLRFLLLVVTTMAVVHFYCGDFQKGNVTSMATTSLQKAKSEKNDEFYTQLADIENELRHYKSQLAGKVIFCNCDDPFESNFFKYFAMNFNQLGLKKLIATCYDPSPVANTQLALFGDDVLIKHKGMKKFANHAYKIELDRVTDVDGSGGISIADVEQMLANEKNILKNGGTSDILTYLEGDGDFRSDECVELLKRSDVVVTNPPFSLFREYIAQLVEYDKRFIIIGNKGAVAYREVFQLIMDNKLWLGYRNINSDMWLVVPDGSKWEKIIDGKKTKHIMACWFTNLDTTKRHEDFTMYKKYSPDDYPEYDNYDAINVNKVLEIPDDYTGVMGVPITFLGQYNPEQFEIIWQASGNTRASAPKDVLKRLNYRQHPEDRGGCTIVNGKRTYGRVFIKRRDK